MQSQEMAEYDTQTLGSVGAEDYKFETEVLKVSLNWCYMRAVCLFAYLESYSALTGQKSTNNIVFVIDQIIILKQSPVDLSKHHVTLQSVQVVGNIQ